MMLRILLRWAFLMAFALSARAQAQDLPIYTDGLQNGFEDFSFGDAGTLPVFNNATPFHNGAPSIALTGNNFNAVSFAHQTQDFSTVQYPGLHLWVHGGTVGGQQLRIYLQLNNAQVATAQLDTYIGGGALVAGQWREVIVNFGSAPLSYVGSFDRIDLQSDINGTQPVLYIDDVALIAATTVDAVFKDGFEDPPAATPGQLQFSAANYGVGEADGTAVISVQRINGSSGAISVSYATSNGTATQPADYTATTGTLSWAAGDAAPKSFSVPINNDLLLEGDETVALAISAPTGGATLVAPTAATLTLSDPELMLVPQYTAHSIKVFTRSAAGFTFGREAPLGAAVSPNALAFAPDGKLWVVDSGATKRLLRYSLQSILTTANPASEVVIGPLGGNAGDVFALAFFGDSAYVSQSDFGATNRVLKFLQANLTVTGNPGPTILANANFSVPAGIAFDTQGRLWTANYGNSKLVAINNGSGATLKLASNVAIGGRDALNQPEGVAFDASDTLWVGNNGKPTVSGYADWQLNDPAFGATVPVHQIDIAPGVENPAGGHTGFVGGLAFDRNAHLWANYENAFSVLEYLLTPQPRPGGLPGVGSYLSAAGQVLAAATTDPGFGGIAFWPVPATLHMTGASPSPTMLIEQSVNDADVGCVGDRFTWRDSSNDPRVAVLAHNTGQTCPGGSRGGELRLLKYQSAVGVTRTVRASASGTSGFGYPVSHPTDENNCTGGGDTSMIGHLRTGSLTRVFEGRHHAIFRFTSTYPRYCTTAPPATEYDLPVTIDWVIATGRDHPLWAITWDETAVPVGRLRDDSRAPYGELLFDGAATEGAHSMLAGVGWGERYKFASTSNPVNYNSGWTWNVLNSVPYVKLWTTTVDATMGVVQTQTMSQHDAGGYFGFGRWRTTSAGGNACNVANFGDADHLMPCDFNWPYQSINYSLNPLVPAATTRNTRLAWGANFGFLGQAQYPVMGSNDNAIGGPVGDGNPNGGNNPYFAESKYAVGWPRQSYSTFVVLGLNSADPVAAQVTQIETVQNVTLTAAIGSVATSGPAGVNRPDTMSYSPAGWNHVYAAWSIQAAANQIDANFNLSAGTLSKPMLVISNWTSPTLPGTVRYKGATLIQDTDYFPSLRPASQELWITLNRDASGASNRLEIF